MIEDFIPQTQPDMCYSAGLLNIVNELGARPDHTPIHYSLRQMNNICGYRVGQHCQDNMVPHWLSADLEPHGYRFVQEPGNEADLEFLTGVVNDPRKSFPLVNVSPNYFDHVGVRNRGAYKWDHILVIMGVNHEVVYFYDPYQTFYRRSTRVEEDPRYIPIPIFLELWEAAFDIRWMCWIEPTDTVQTKLPNGE